MGAIFGGISLSKNQRLPLMLNALQFYDAYKFSNKKSLTIEGIDIHFFEQTIKGQPYDDGLYYDDHVVVLITGIIDFPHEFSKAKFMYEKYLKEGIDFINNLDGDFAFVIYDKVLEKVFISRDHVGKVMLYYTIHDNCLFFSTLINPLLKIGRTNNTINMKWASIFASINVNLHNIQDELTIYDNIYMVKIAHFIEFTNEGLRKVKFWDPEKIKTNKRWDKSKYLEKFTNEYKDAIDRRLCSNMNVGVSLSGGLDSTSIYVNAASLLKEKNKMIYSYSSIPSKEYTNKLPKDYIPDESEYINEVLKRHDNGVHKYTSSDHYNAFNIIERYLSFYELPYKFIANSAYMLDIAELASKDGCNILLTGGHGNLTISRGSIEAQLLDLIKSLKFYKLYKDISIYCKNNEIGRKRFIVNIIKSVFSHDDSKLGFVNQLVDKQISERFEIEKEIKRKIFNYKSLVSNKVQKRFVTNDLVLNQMSEFETKLALETGVITRDPTRDHKLIELLYQIPDDAFCENGVERSLIINAHKNILPDKILYNYNKRGIQSADWIRKLECNWNSVIVEIRSLIQDERLLNYINRDELEMLLDKYQTLKFEECNFLEIKLLMIILNLGKHEKMFNQIERRV